MKQYILTILIITPLLLFAQEKQPKVGLVLSGGGAKGFAHIGVLKEIEKAGLQIDYIGGTSMGAIVGGLFAAGYTSAQIEEMVVNTDFLSLLQDINPRRSEPFFEKEYGEKHIITFPVNKGSISFPKGVSRGQSILNTLSLLLAPVDSIKDFSKLPIPFFCIATDAETGGEVLLEKGSLPLSLRASGSFPTILDPVELDGKLLIDGGVVNNFPTDIMKTKDVDIIIGVNVQGQLFTKEKLTSALTILSQIVKYKVYENTSKQKKIADIYIQPDIRGYTAVDFTKSKELMQKGEEVALEYTDIFKEIASKQKAKKVKIPLKVPEERFLIDKIGTYGMKDYTRAYVLGKLNIQKGDSISHKEITDRITFLSATNNYERIDYNVKKTKKGVLLNFYVKESMQKASLRLGLHYDLLYKSSILANYNHKSLLGKNDVLSFDLVLGDNVRYNLNYFVDNGFYTSYGFRSSYNHFRTNTSFNQVLIADPSVSKINVGYTDFTNQLFIQTTFSRRFAMGLGAEFKRLIITTETLATEENDVVTFEGSNFLNAFAYVKLDTYDKKYFPNEGFFADINFKWYGWSDRNKNLENLAEGSARFDPFFQLRSKIGFTTTFGGKFTFRNINELGLGIDSPEDFNSFDFILGGYNQNYINTIVPFYGYGFADLVNDSFLKTELHARYEFLKDHYAMVIANYVRLEGDVLQDISFFKGIKSGYAIGYSLNSIVGPIELKYAWSPGRKQSFVLFNLGFWF